MCISAAVLAGAALVTSAVGTVASISSASANAAAQQEQLAIQRKQMTEQMQLERLQASQAESQRLGDYRRQRAANLAAIAGSGIGEHLSFLGGIAPAEARALAMDLANIRLGLLGSENRMAAEIRVNRLNSDVAGYNKNMAVLQAGLAFAGQAAQIGSYYNAYNVPGSTTAAPAKSSGGLAPVDSSLPGLVPRGQIKGSLILGP